MEPLQTQKSNPAIPIAIVVGFALIAFAIYFTSSKQVAAPAVTDFATTSPQLTGTPRPVDATDYIRGNPNAPILMVEYSDYDCPFCKKYHEALTQVIDELGAGGKVAWVYRQFPIAQLHPNAPKISEAALCVGSIGGNDAFWKFTDLVFEERAIDEQTNMVKLPDYAEQIGVKKDEFNTCFNSNKMAEAVKTSAAEGFSIGARGTPYTIVIVGNEQAVINGAQSYDTVRGIIQNLINQLEGGTTPKNTETNSTSTPQ
jgi:protein-disulfide isomerase